MQREGERGDEVVNVRCKGSLTTGQPDLMLAADYGGESL